MADIGDTTPWSVRGVPSDVRGAAVAQAKKAGLSVGDWLAAAIREKVKNDRNAGKSLTVRQKGPVSLTDASKVVDLVVQMAAAGLTVPDNVQKSAFQLVTRMAADVKKGSHTDTPGKSDRGEPPVIPDAF